MVSTGGGLLLTQGSPIYHMPLIYDIVTSPAQSVVASEPVFMNLCVTAGTGKTYLINALKQVLGEKCIVTATTGIAGFSINGQTLHSAAQLPICDHSFRVSRCSVSS